MTRKSNAQKILDALAARSGLDDDELSRAAGITPRQAVNQRCRQLERQGLVVRTIGPRGKIINFLAAGFAGERPLAKHQASTPCSKPSPNLSRNLARHQGTAVGTDPARTLFIIPCCGRKMSGGHAVERQPSILDELPADLATRLEAARKTNHGRGDIDETALAPAWKRYTGTLYVSARDSLENAAAAGLHVLIVSGGYGVVLVAEPIGMYEAVFRPSWWPCGLIEQILGVYAARHGLTKVRAIVSATTAYRKVVERVDWRAAGVDDALLLSPAHAGGGAMVKVPRAQGEALADLLENRFVEGWVSSDGLRLHNHRLLAVRER